MKDEDLDFLYEDLENGLQERQKTVFGELSSKVERMLDLQEDIEDLEEQLESLKKQYNQVARVEIPELFSNAGISSIDFGNYKVSVVQGISGKVVNTPGFISLLEQRGQEQLAKTSLVLGKVPSSISKQVSDYVYKLLGEYPEVDNSIHSQTLKKWLRENVSLANPEEGDNASGEGYKLHMQDLNGIVDVFTYSETKIKAIKANP